MKKINKITEHSNPKSENIDKKNINEILHIINDQDKVITQAIANPALGQLRASNELKQQGILISSSGVRSIWLRNDLETMRKRLKVLEAKSAQDGIVLTEEQLAALEQSNSLKEVHGEIDTEHPGYLGSQDT